MLYTVNPGNNQIKLFEKIELWNFILLGGRETIAGKWQDFHQNSHMNMFLFTRIFTCLGTHLK